MKRIALILLACLLALQLPTALGEDAPAGYVLPYDYGTIFSLFVLPNGDILYQGSFAVERDDMRVDGSVIRSTPTGEIVWEHHFPYVGETGGGTLVKLSNGQYVTPESEGDFTGLFTLYFFDEDKGLVSTVESVKGAFWTPCADGMTALNFTNSDRHTLRMYLYDLEGTEQNVLSFPFATSMLDPLTVETSDGGFILAIAPLDTPATSYRVWKIDQDGQSLWQVPFLTPYGTPFAMVPDGQDGVYLVCDAWNDSNTSLVIAVDKDGNTRWEKPMFHGEGWFILPQVDESGSLTMLCKAETGFQFHTLSYEGDVETGPVIRNPASMADMYVGITGYVKGTDGQLMMIGTYSNPEGTIYTPFVMPLSVFSWAE